MYKVTLTLNSGQRQVLKEDDDWDFYMLTRALDKCEIKAFTVELAGNI